MPDTANRTQFILLRGGPRHLERLHPHLGDDPERIAVRHLNGYEHYEATGEYACAGDQELPIFGWIYQTKIAE
ncbi:DUF5988 family protein [Streptomyces sp. NPDC087300]|uniref:DUF5988 family protein n=1 Tax=Streptomyces sp. NPDC087300 TaxID=3365780 RepID=UPI003812885F